VTGTVIPADDGTTTRSFQYAIDTDIEPRGA
jgi:hypothetical protein